MSSIENNLYPPIVDTYAPSFIYDDINGGFKVYFRLSQFNSIQELHTNNLGEVDLIQVTIQNQNDNYSIFDQSQYPNGIKFVTCDFNNDDGSGLKYIYFPLSDFINNSFSFELNTYYKIQIRFTGKDASDPTNGQSVSNDWIADNLSYFSQWSSITLIRPISRPNLKIVDLEGQNITIGYNHIAINGDLSFEDNEDTEKLRSYQIQLFDNNENLIEDSQIQYPIEINKIIYSIKHRLQENQSYKIKILIITEDFYEFEKQYNLTVNDSLFPFKDFDISIIQNSSKGCINISLENKNYIENEEKIAIKYGYKWDEPDSTILQGSTLYFNLVPNHPFNIQNDVLRNFNTSVGLVTLQKTSSNYLNEGMYILVCRTSTRSNFEEWEDLGIIPINNEFSKIIWNDFTVEPGIWYKYDFIKCNSNHNRLGVYENQENYMIDNWDIFISDKDRQLKITLDPQISNFSTKINESIIETIGSKYPFIRKNDTIRYRTFSLAGTISAFMDLDFNTFKASKKELYKDSKDLYDIYNKDNNINYFNDFIYQKFFREEVIDFLLNDNIKLFRSLTEGNMLVKLSNITLTPNTTLGRRIYNFSCTVYEIADASNFNNINKYKIMSKYRGG